MWKKTPAGLELTAGHVDIWRIPLDLSNDQINGYLAFLSPDEVERANRFKVKRKYREYIISRGLLREILGRTLNRDPREFRFQYTQHEKPYLDIDSHGLPVYFNVSHSHAQTLIAVTLGHTLGIDIEHVRNNIDFRKLANRFFSNQESQELNTFTDTGIPRAFFACWTRKEAFVKALGDGISFGLSEFSVSADPFIDEVPLTTHWDTDEAKNWSLINLKTGGEYIAALAVNKHKPVLRYWEGQDL